MSEARPWQVDVGRLRRAHAVHTVVLQVILVLLVLIAGALAGLATANVATREVVAALDEPGAAAGPMEWDQFRALRNMSAYYGGGASTYHAVLLGGLGAVFLVLALTVRRRLLPDGVGRRRLVLTLAAVAATYVLFLVVVGPFREIGRRVALDRQLLLPISAEWTNAVENSFLVQVPLAAATLALAFAALTPSRVALPALGAVAGVGFALVLLSCLPFGPLARPDEPPESFLDAPPRAVRVLLAGERPRVLRGVLPDVGLAAVPPPLGPETEAAAAAAAATHGLDDLRGAIAARLHALAPLARFDPAESARRLAALYERTRDDDVLRRLADALRGQARDAGAPGLALLADTARFRLGSAAADVCGARVARGELDAAGKLKDAVRAEGASDEVLAGCVVATPPPPGTIAGTVTVDGRLAAGIAVALLDENAAGVVAAATADGFDLATLAGTPTVRTDEAGAWRFSALPAGRYRIAVLLEDARYAPDPRTARPADGIVLEPGADVVVPALALTTRIE